MSCYETFLERPKSRRGYPPPHLFYHGSVVCCVLYAVCCLASFSSYSISIWLYSTRTPPYPLSFFYHLFSLILSYLHLTSPCFLSGTEARGTQSSRVALTRSRCWGWRFGSWRPLRRCYVPSALALVGCSQRRTHVLQHFQISFHLVRSSSFRPGHGSRWVTLYYTVPVTGLWRQQVMTLPEMQAAPPANGSHEPAWDKLIPSEQYAADQNAMD